jgi:hypothetical protein
MKFWSWFFWGTGGKSGIRKYFDFWLFIHLLFGVIFAWTLPVLLKDAANTVLLPLAGIFIGLSFAWGGNAQAILQTEEIDKLTDHHPGGFEEYIYTFQSAILVILCTLVLWGLAGLGFFDNVWPKNSNRVGYLSVTAFLFFMASLTLRECWHIVLGAQWLLIARRKIKKLNQEHHKK